MMENDKIRIALLQDRDRGSAAAAADMTERLIAEAAANGSENHLHAGAFPDGIFLLEAGPGVFRSGAPDTVRIDGSFLRVAKRHEVVLFFPCSSIVLRDCTTIPPL